MYDELIKRLMECATEAGACKTCELYSSSSCTDDLMKQAADAIAELQGRAKVLEKLADKWCEAVPKWISVTERLPKDLQNVLVIDDGRVTIGHCEHFYADEQIYVEWHDTLYYPIDPPYWMPLPEPPKEG